MLEKNNGDSSFIWHVFFYKRHILFCNPCIPKNQENSSWGCSTHLKNMSQIASFPKVGVKMKKCLKPPPRIKRKKKKLLLILVMIKISTK